MLPNPRKITFKFKRPENGFPDSSFLGSEKLGEEEKLLEISSSSEEEEEEQEEERSSSKQMVIYDPESASAVETAAAAVIEPRRRVPGFQMVPSRPLPSVGAFTVQCAKCFKWRLIPSKEKYEEIRERILERPFFCETARSWRPDLTCEAAPDISQDGSRLWAIDKPNIAQAPPGWQRLLRIRGEGSTKFADVYYVAPSGKRLRSMVEIDKYLTDHPEYRTQGMTMSQFSFRCPKPLQDNYVRKRPRPLAPCDAAATRTIEPDLVRPLAWARPEDESTELQLGMPSTTTISEPDERPAKR